MDYDLKRPALSQIDEEDVTFRVSTHGANDALRLSVHAVGLIHPPVLWERQGRWVVVSGFARMAACRSLGWREVPARCLPPGTPFAQCALVAVADNAAQRELNVVEMARALDLLTRAAGNRDGARQMARSIGLPAGDELVEKLAAVTHMSDQLQDGLCSGRIALPMALRLHALADKAAAEALASLFQALEWGLNRQREFLDWVQAIAHRDGIAVTAVLADEPLRRWRQDPELDKGRKSQLIRSHVRKRRYPAITAHEEQYAGMVKALKMPNGIQLIAPPHFEGRTYRLWIDFDDPDQLAQRLHEAQRMAASPLLKQLMGLAASS